MPRLFSLLCALIFGLVLLAACDVPKPPPEVATPTAGSNNPESELFVGDSTPVRVTPEPGFTPVAAPPGTIYFVRASGLWRVSPEGTDAREIAPGPVTGRPVPSPDGKSIAFISGRDLVLVASEGGEPRKLFTGNMAAPQRLGWTPDGSALGFISLDPANAGSEQAWAISMIAGEPLLITDLPQSAVARGATYERSVVWSPDGRWVVVSGVNNPMRLLRWPLSRGQEGDQTDIPGGEPDWSPDSGTILYTESMSGALLIYEVLSKEFIRFRNIEQFEGTGFGEYSQGPGPLWSPAARGADSDPLAFRSRTAEGVPFVSFRQRGGLELLPLPTLTNNPSWSPSGDQVVVETGTLTDDPLGAKWIPEGLAIARLNLTGEQTLRPLLKNAQWPAWGK